MDNVENIQRRTRNAPFIEITDMHRHLLHLDYRRIVAVRDVSYDAERHAMAVIVIDGVPKPLLVDDDRELILDMLKAAGASFISLSFADRKVINVDPRRIIGVKGHNSNTSIFIDGFSNITDDGDIDYSIAVTNGWSEILTMIRQANQRA